MADRARIRASRATGLLRLEQRRSHSQRGGSAASRPLEGRCRRAPVTDMARFHTAGGGRNWIAEYGSPEDPDDLDVLMRYSPYHTLPPRIEAPAILTIVPDEDDRVAPWHGYKMHASWLAANASENPVLLLGEARAGHRGSPAVGRTIDRYADIWAFFFERLDAARHALQDPSV